MLLNEIVYGFITYSNVLSIDQTKDRSIDQLR